MKKILSLLSLCLIVNFSQAQVTYTVDSIAYQPDPYNGGTALPINMDDIFSLTQPIGFTFNFFGINYDSIIVSSNGSVNFNTSLSGGYAQWVLSGISIPNPMSSIINSIMAPYQDLLATNPQANIRMDLKGLAPYRRLVVSFDSVGLFGCTTSSLFSNQIIMYETTNIIEIHMQNKPLCTSWGGSIALLGIQDSAGTTGYSPPNRNGGTPWTASNESWRFTPSNAGPSNPNSCKVKGNIYFDMNSNCLKDAGEYGNMNRYVLTDVGSYYAYTNIDGNYEMLVDTGSYIVSHNPYGNVSVLCPPSNQYTVSFATINDSIDQINFGDSTQICADVYSTSGLNNLRYCHNNHVTIPYGNIGSIPSLNTVLTVTIPDSTYASAFSIAPTSVIGNVYTFNLGTLYPGQMSFLTFKDSVICDTNWIGTTRCFSTNITSSVGDCDNTNDSDSSCYTVVASFDPNDKTAMVEHASSSPFTHNGIVYEDEWITYKVNFQNTGTAEAFHVLIRDSLDVNTLDINTVQFLGASHLCTMIKNTNHLTFRFDDIHLIDSVTDEPNSHGWLKFKVKSMPSLANGTQVINTAGIYFDNNPVVNTNANTLTVYKPSAVADIERKNQLVIYPNPMQSETMIRTPITLKDAVLSIYSLTGQKVFSDMYHGTDYLLKRNALRSGMYTVQIEDIKGNVLKQKLSIKD